MIRIIIKNSLQVFKTFIIKIIITVYDYLTKSKLKVGDPVS